MRGKRDFKESVSGVLDVKWCVSMILIDIELVTEENAQRRRMYGVSKTLC